jgi:hypothetical protein
MARPRDADLLREAEELQRLLLVMARTHPAAAQRLAIDFQDTQLEYRAGRLVVQDYCAELTEIRRRLAQHFAALPGGATDDYAIPLPPKGEKLAARFVRDAPPAASSPKRASASTPVRKPSLYS